MSLFYHEMADRLALVMVYVKHIYSNYIDVVTNNKWEIHSAENGIHKVYCARQTVNYAANIRRR